MLGTIFKFSISFVISFVIMSFQINNQTIFSHLTEIAGPLGTDVQDSLKRSVKRSFKKTKKMIKNADTNSIQDTVESHRSSVNKKKDFVMEELKKDEVKKLDELIRNN